MQEPRAHMKTNAKRVFGRQVEKVIWEISMCPAENKAQLSVGTQCPAAMSLLLKEVFP